MDYYVSQERLSFHENPPPRPQALVESYLVDSAAQHLVALHGDYQYFPQPADYQVFAPATEYISSQSTDYPQKNSSYPSEVPLHAPVPLSGYSSLISPASPQQPTPHLATPSHFDSSPSSSQSLPTPAEPESPLEYYGSMPQVMFPTPSELLTDLAARDQSALSATPTSESKPPSSTAASTRTKAKSAKQQPETQRKAYFRSVAESIGFQPTDPDTITSHDKKRSYLECLERYVQWLHEQIQLAGHQPVPLERITTYRGLSNRSIRTLLVHMQDDIRTLHVLTVEDERTYVELQNELRRRQLQQDHRQHTSAPFSYGGAAPEPAVSSQMLPFYVESAQY